MENPTEPAHALLHPPEPDAEVTGVSLLFWGCCCSGSVGQPASSSAIVSEMDLASNSGTSDVMGAMTGH